MAIRTPSNVKGNKSLTLVWSKWGSQWWGLRKLFNVLQSPIGWMASRPMRNIKTFPSNQMYLCPSLVERKVADFNHNIDRRRHLVWLKWLIFIAFSGQLMVSLVIFLNTCLNYAGMWNGMFFLKPLIEKTPMSPINRRFMQINHRFNAN